MDSFLHFLDSIIPLLTLVITSGIATPLAIKAWRLLNSSLLHIKDVRRRQVIQLAVHYVQQKFASSPDDVKLKEAEKYASDHGFPNSSRTIEAFVHLMKQAAQTDLKEEKVPPVTKEEIAQSTVSLLQAVRPLPVPVSSGDIAHATLTLLKDALPPSTSKEDIARETVSLLKQELPTTSVVQTVHAPVQTLLEKMSSSPVPPSQTMKDPTVLPLDGVS